MTGPDVLTGVLPVAPTVFTDDEELDVAGLRRVCDYLIDSGVAGICILANYSEQFSLTDDERDVVLETVLDHVAGRVPVCVTTSHYSARIAADRCAQAAERGADLVMLMPPFFGATLRVGPGAVLDYFHRIADEVQIPIMIQDAPMSPTALPVELIGDLATKIDTVRYAKIEVPQAAAKIGALAEWSEALPGIFDGEEAVTLIPDLRAGAVGTMSSVLAAAELVSIMRRWTAGDSWGAEEEWERLLPLLHYENRQCGLAAAKAVLAAGGVITSDRTRAPFQPLPAATRDTLIDLARRRDAFALRWAA
ncbi:dihydrodipicolinate synthase family protein [Microlunatus sp. Gsoil 973]|uniref:dihydrodipicolinate synthase family protein n=1 Tax=Microlunatus sp. Gsoil 973 TaxID=2672569 RepID=UPI001E3A7AA1|nr:dihydrodipicolinate synthase family protein [Microlunatus sp. Gsoil 973]